MSLIYLGFLCGWAFALIIWAYALYRARKSSLSLWRRLTKEV